MIFLLLRSGNLVFRPRSPRASAQLTPILAGMQWRGRMFSVWYQKSGLLSCRVEAGRRLQEMTSPAAFSGSSAGRRWQDYWGKSIARDHSERTAIRNVKYRNLGKKIKQNLCDLEQHNITYVCGALWPYLNMTEVCLVWAVFKASLVEEVHLDLIFSVLFFTELSQWALGAECNTGMVYVYADNHAEALEQSDWRQ